MSVSDTGRRRRWSDAEKLRIVEESHCDGVSLAEVARRHEITRSQLYDWRYRHKYGLLGSTTKFMRLVSEDDVRCTEDLLPASPMAPPAIIIDLGPMCRMTIPAGFDMEAAARLLSGVMVRP